MMSAEKQRYIVMKDGRQNDDVVVVVVVSKIYMSVI